MRFICVLGCQEFSTTAKGCEERGLVEALFSPQGFVSTNRKEAFVDMLESDNIAGFKICDSSVSIAAYLKRNKLEGYLLHLHI